MSRVCVSGLKGFDFLDAHLERLPVVGIVPLGVRFADCGQRLPCKQMVIFSEQAGRAGGMSRCVNRLDTKAFLREGLAIGEYDIRLDGFNREDAPDKREHPGCQIPAPAHIAKQRLCLDQGRDIICMDQDLRSGHTSKVSNRIKMVEVCVGEEDTIESRNRSLAKLYKIWSASPDMPAATNLTDFPVQIG